MRTKYKHGARRGMVTELIIVSAVLLFGLLGIALDMSVLALKRRQALGACDAASLAGAARLMDDSVLYPHLAHLSENDRRGLTLLRIEEAKRVAAKFAAKNYVGRSPVVLDVNTASSLNSNLIAGYRADPTSVEEKMLVWEGEGPVNALVARVERSRRLGNPLTMWFAKGAGLPYADLTVESQAVVDQRVCGFRPAGAVNIPMFPLAVLPLCDGLGWYEQAALLAGQESDRFTVEESSGEVFAGGDGIPEIVVRLGIFPADEPLAFDNPHRDNAREGVNEDLRSETNSREKARKLNSGLLYLLNSDNKLANLENLAKRGVGGLDLSNHNGEFCLGLDDRLSAPVIAELEPGELSEVKSALASIVGEKRIWPLGARAVFDEEKKQNEHNNATKSDAKKSHTVQAETVQTETEQTETEQTETDKSEGQGGGRETRRFEIVSFGAGRVVDCQLVEGRELLVLIQPCLLQTPTALVRPGQPINPWIGKLMLTR